MPTACLECGLELEYDFAACPRCGWQPPAAWSLDEEGDAPQGFKHSPVMKKKPPLVSRRVGFGFFDFFMAFLSLRDRFVK